jgi:hypothetical protein
MPKWVDRVAADRQASNLEHPPEVSTHLRGRQVHLLEKANHRAEVTVKGKGKGKGKGSEVV